jgi:multidrug efflux pump subunit AcrA (membrane-fusion protein)
MSRKKWLVILGLGSIIAGGGRRGYDTWFAENADSDSYISNTMAVKTGDIVNALTMNGRAKFSNMQKLTFPQSGRITAVYKKVGDMVKAGEIIAKMDTYELDNELEQAKIALENEQRALEKVLNSSKKALEIMQAEKDYLALTHAQQNAPANLELALQTIENEYVNKQNEYNKAVRDYEKKQKEYDTKKKTYEEIIALDKSGAILHSDELLKNKVEDLKFTADGLRKELDALDKLMVYTTKYGTTKPDYYIYIGAKDASTKNKVESLFWQILSEAAKIHTRASSGQSATLPEVQLKAQLIQQYEQLKKIADIKTELHTTLEKMFEASIESAGVSSWSAVSVGDGRSLKSSSNTTIDEILGLTTPETIGQKRKTELDNLKIELDTMQQSLAKLKIEYEQLDTEKAKKIATTKMEYEMKALEMKIAKTNLEELKAGDNEAVKLAKNNIKQREKTIETLLKKYDVYSLKANFDGVITKMNLQLGDTAGTTTSTASMDEKSVYIENPHNLEIQLTIDQSDITKLTPGMPVQIKLDALPKSLYTGTLVEIDTTAGDDMGGGYGGGSTNYKAKVVFTKKPEDTILGAMTATITVVLAEAKNVLMVPNIAISTGPEGAVVMKVENKKYKKVPITTGISNQTHTQVLSGLSEGDMIMGVFIDKEGIEAAGLDEEQPSLFGEM